MSFSFPSLTFYGSGPPSKLVILKPNRTPDIF